jgi:hypothetical protein
MKARARIALFAAACWFSTTANAAYFIQASEIGGNVVFTGSGSLNLAALTPSSLIAPNGNPDATRLFAGILPPGNFGSGEFTGLTTTTGAQIGVLGTSLRAPLGYISGAYLGTSTATFESSTFSSLGLAAGNYVWNWGQGASSDTLTLQIGDVSAVPEPATWGMMLLGFGLIGGALRAQRRQTTIRASYA